MKLYLIRHCETIEWENGIILWHLNWNLSKKWILDAKRIWKFLKNSDFWIEKILTSDLKRAIETSQIINKYLNLKIEKLNILRERWAWIVEWKKENEINWDLYENKKLPYRKHIWWESFLDVKKRAKYFLDNLPEESWNLLIISHNVFILMLICVLKKITIKKALSIDIKNKIICIDFGNNYHRPIINYYNF